MTKTPFTKAEKFSASASAFEGMKPETVLTSKVVNNETVNFTVADAIDFFNHELELLGNKNKKTELTDTQKENLEIAEKIIAWMRDNHKSSTIADIRKHFGYSSQKLSPIMAKLENAGRLTSAMEKRIKTYTIVE